MTSRARSDSKALHTQHLLSVAIEGGQSDLLATALALGASPNACPYPNAVFPRSTLSFACEKGKLDIVLDLLRAGALPNGLYCDISNLSEPIRIACRFGLPAIVLALANAGANLNINKRKAPLISEFIGSPDIVSALISAGADLNERDILGHTPLMIACSPHSMRRPQSALKSLSLLIQAGADARLLNYGGRSASTLASKWGFSHAALLIEAAIERDALLAHAHAPSAARKPSAL